MSNKVELCAVFKPRAGSAGKPLLCVGPVRSKGLVRLESRAQRLAAPRRYLKNYCFMRRFMKTDCGVSMLQPRTILTVGQILKNYFTNGEIPQATNSRPYDFESETDDKGFSHAKGFDGVFARDLHPDLFKAVSRESRESARKKAALSQDHGSSIKAAAETAKTVSATEGAGE